MEVDTLRTLVLVAQKGSFAAAARVLDLDPSSVSRTISGLETELGMRLFERSTRRLALTQAGNLYVRRIEPLVEELDKAREDVRQGTIAVSGRVRVTASIAFGSEILMPILPALETQLPNVEVEFVLSDDPVDLVGARMDLAIRLAPSPTGDLISARLMDTRYMVVASPDYLANACQLKTPQDLQHLACLRYALPDFKNVWQFKRDQDVQNIEVTGHALISNALALREAARHGNGPALLADWLIRSDLDQGKLVDVFPDWDVTATTFDTGAWLLYPSRTFLPARTRAVIDVLRAHITRRSVGPS